MLCVFVVFGIFLFTREREVVAQAVMDRDVALDGVGDDWVILARQLLVSFLLDLLFVFIMVSGIKISGAWIAKNIHKFLLKMRLMI